MAKRKRDGYSAEQSRATPPSSPDEAERPQHITVAEQPFEVEVLPNSGASKASKDQANWTGPLTQPAVVPNGIECTYRISPAERWKKMRKYSKFIVGKKSFGVGDYVYIYHGDQLRGTQLDPALTGTWVAQVLEIRAADSYHVYLRLFWMYWPDELPGGRETYHGPYELIASNHMEIVDAMTVADKADVLHMEDDSSTPTCDLYWRQTLDFLTNKLNVRCIAIFQCWNVDADEIIRAYENIVTATNTISQSSSSYSVPVVTNTCTKPVSFGTLVIECGCKNRTN